MRFKFPWWTYVVAVIGLLGFVLYNFPVTADRSTQSAASIPVSGPAIAASADAVKINIKSIDLQIEKNRMASGPSAIRLVQGDEITLNIRTDRADELHIHGYDLRANLLPGQVVSLTFIATVTGRFGIELHKAHVAIGALEVYPN
jgi:heme/copper-type cytochrome/quinol oxidase subunit 2